MKNKMVIMMCLGLVLLGIAIAYADTTTGLIAYYPFTGNAVDTVGGNNGTVYNATLTTDRFGNPNSAYSFNGISTLSGGGSYIQLANNFDFVTSPWGNMGDLTFSAWVKPAGDGGYIFHQANGGQLGLGTFVDVSTSGEYANFFAHLATGYDGTWYEAIGPAPLAQDAWVNLTGVYKAQDKNELWVNGNLVNTINLVPSPLFYNTWWLTYVYAGFGAYNESRYPDSLQGAFEGTIDDFRIYNRALTQADIQELAGTSPVPEPATMILFGIGSAAMAFVRRKKKLS